MKLRKITIGDGRTVTVDDERFSALDEGIRSNPQLIQLLASGQFQGRDASEGLVMLVSQLAYTEAKVYERQYQPMQYEQFLPITNEAGEWADQIRYEIEDRVGQGKRQSGKGKDINLVDSAIADKTFPVFNGVIGYDYTMEELRRTAFLRRPLSERRMNTAMEGYRRHLNAVGLAGELGVTGFYNNANVPTGNAPNGAWATTNLANQNLWLADINALIFLIWNTTQFNDQITDIVLPPANLNLAGSTARSINSDTTVLEFVKKNNIAKNERNIDITFSAGYALGTAGAGATGRMIGYVKSQDRLVMHVPLPLRFLAPQLVGLSVEIPGEYKYSGVEWRYPGSAYYMDGM